MKKYNVQKIRHDFPILDRKIYGKPLIYLDNAATSLKPKPVIDVLSRHHLYEASNVHRGVHYLSEKGTEAFESVRLKVKNFINAENTHEIIFTKGTTNAINMVARSFGQRYIKKGDEILITHMEHHSNIVPWQMLAEERGCILKVVPITDAGELDMASFEKLINSKTKLVSLVHVSNSLGTINPVKRCIDIAHKNNVPVLVDGAQAIAKLPVDVKELDCDFYAFSSHKMFGPTGVGVLYGKEKFLNEMPPYEGGGDMILSVTFEKTIYNSLPYKFEAGTPTIGGVIGFGAAVDYVASIGLEAIERYEKELLDYASEKILTIKDLTIIGKAREKLPIISFILKDIHPHDVGTILDGEGIAIRTGHHCTQPVMQRYDIPATSRLSLSIYNTKSEIDAAIIAIEKVKEVFK